MEENKEKQARLWGMLCHLLALLIFIGIPFGNIIGPLVVWIIKKDEFPFVNEQGKESLNFQISMTIYSIIALFLVIVIIGIPILIALAIADVILVIIAAVRANEGQSFKYPITIRFFS